MQAALYLRQSKDRHGNELAVARQREDGLRLCSIRGWEPVEYVDNDTSASKGGRPAYTKMLRDIESGRINAVVVWDLDRLHRRPVELEHFMELADKHSLALATVTGEVDLSTDNGRLFARIKGAVARAEVERKAARQRRQAQQAAENGSLWGGRRAFGYNRDGTHRDPEAAMIKAAYEGVMQGDSLHSIAKQWNLASVPTTSGNQWIGSTVRQVLVNPRYAGKRTYKGEIIATEKVDWEPMVDEEIWHSALAILTAPGRRRGSNVRKNLLTGILVCGNCHELMGSGVAHNGGDPIYACKKCYRNSRRLAPIDKLINGLVLGFLSSSDASTLMVDKERRNIGELLKQEGEVIKQLETLGVDYAEGNLTGVQVRVATTRLEDKLEKIRAKMRDATTGEVFEGLFGEDPEKWWKQLSLERRRAVIKRLMVPTLHPVGRGRPFEPEQLSIRWLTAEE